MHIQQVDLDHAQILANLYSQDDREHLPQLQEFWNNWFTDQIPGEKLTLMASIEGKAVGAVRFWRSPLCQDKWLIEGLEVASTHRRQGLGRLLVQEGLLELRQRGVKKVFAHIHRDNSPSILLHQGLGFQLISTEYINSWGDIRTNGGEYMLELI